MKILSAYFKGYIRLALNNIQEIELTFTEIIQLFLGTNGSGKSSLLRELTPLPGDPNMFTKGGCKIIKISHRNNYYVLTNNYGQKVEHSFIKDDVELNEGRNVTTQRELVFREFGITNEIHLLITGKEKFHAMNAVRRREWFAKLCPTDYNYAFKKFNQIRVLARDLTGALRTARKSIGSAAEDILSDKDEKELFDACNVIHGELNTLLREAGNARIDLPALHDLQKTYQQELSTISMRLLRMRLTAPYGTDVYGRKVAGSGARVDEWGTLVQDSITDIADVDQCISQLKDRRVELETKINVSAQTVEELNKRLAILEKTETEGIDELQRKVIANQAEQQRLNFSKQTGIEIDNPESCLHAINTIHEAVFQIVTALPSNSDKQYGLNKMNDAAAAQLGLGEQILTVKEKITSLNYNLGHLQSHIKHNTVSCPKCKFSWANSLAGKDEATLTKEIADAEERLKELKKKSEDVAGIYKTNLEYGELYRSFIRITNTWPILLPLWNYIKTEEQLIHAPATILPLIESYKVDAGIQAEINRLQIETKDLLELIQSASQLGDEKLVDVRSRLSEAVDNVTTFTHQLHQVSLLSNQYTQYRSQLLEADALSARVTKLMQNTYQCTDQMIEGLRQESLNHCIRQLQTALAVKQEVLNKALLQKNLIAELQAQILKLTIEEEAANVLLKELSPNDGLIAAGLLGFVRRFTSHMNVLIKKVWAYPLVIQDCGTMSENSVELDYRFPMRVKNNIVKDVDEGSTAMIEMVDLAFIVEAMKALGLGESPLYLDEFGHSFDEVHRAAASTAVKTIMETQAFTQLFTISHYSSVYGVFTKAEVCALDTTNITVPKEYNCHVDIK